MTDTHKPWQFKPGQSGNPAGRPKGARSKLSEDFVGALYADFKTHGTKAVVDAREADPVAYLKIIASLMPKHVEVRDVALDELDRDELASLIDAVREARGTREAIGAGSLN